MQTARRVGWMSGALVCGLSTLALAEAASSETSVSAELAALKAEVAQMRAERGENWLNQRRAEEIKALVREVLQDADTRASLQSGGMTAGHNGKNFFLASEDGTFLMNIGMRAQFRYIANMRNDAGSGQDDTESGFQLRRLKPRFSGFVADPKITYSVTLAANRNDDSLGLEEVKLGYRLGEGLTLEAGRYKAPFLREELTSSGKQLAVERSLVNEFFTMGYAEGVGLTWEASPMMKVTAMFNDGQNSGEIGGTGEDFHNDLVDYAGTARVDLKLAGNWKQMEDFTAWQGEPMGIFVGLAVHGEQAETGNTGGTADNGYFFAWTVDGSFENEGWGLYGAIINKIVDGDSYNYDQWGVVAQLSYNFDDHLEPFVRYEWYKGGGSLLNTTGGVGGYSVPAAGQKDNAQLLTFGANYYLKKHNAKFTADVVWALDPLYLGSGVTGLGLLSDGTGNRNQVVVRGQFQLEF